MGGDGLCPREEVRTAHAERCLGEMLADRSKVGDVTAFGYSEKHRWVGYQKGLVNQVLVGRNSVAVAGAQQ